MNDSISSYHTFPGILVCKFCSGSNPEIKKPNGNALTNLASNALYPYHMELHVMENPSISDEAILIADTQINDSWMLQIASYLKNGVLPKDKRDVVITKARAAKHALIYNVLYRRSFSGPY